MTEALIIGYVFISLLMGGMVYAKDDDSNLPSCFVYGFFWPVLMPFCLGMVIGSRMEGKEAEK